MAGLSMVVFPVLGVIGVVKHLSLPSEKRTDEANTYFSRYILGLFLSWIGFEIRREVDALISTIVILAGIYLCLFNGVWLFAEKPKSD